MRMSKKMSSIVAAVALVATGGYAADGTWSLLNAGDADGNWSDVEPGNWLNGQVAGGSDSTATFSLDITTASVVTLTQPRTIQQIVFSDTATGSAANWTLAGSSTNKLTLAGTSPSISVNHSYGAIWSPRTVTVSAPIEGTAGLTKSGVGYLVLSGANAYSGGTNIAAGVLQINSNSNIGGVNSGDVTLSGGNLRFHGGSLDNKIVVTGNSTISSNDGSPAVSLNGAVSIGAGTKLTVEGQSRAFTFAGQIGGDGEFLAHGGTISLTNAANSIAKATLTGATLRLGSNSALGPNQFYLAQRDADATIASTNAEARTISNAISLIGKGSYSTIFGQTSGGTGNLTFSGNGTLGTMRAVVNNTTEFSGSLSGTAALVLHTGSTGSLIFSGANTYSGTVAVNAGTLRVNNITGSGTGTAAVNVGGGTLGGDGSISGTVTVNSGTLAPGNSAGSLGLGSLILNGGTVAMEIAALDSYDMLDITGALTYGGTLNVSAINGFNLAQEGSYNLFDFGSSSGSLTAVNVGGVALAPSSGRWSAVDAGATYTFDPGTGVLSVVVPEPTVIGLVSAVSLLAMARRRRAR